MHRTHVGIFVSGYKMKFLLSEIIILNNKNVKRKTYFVRNVLRVHTSSNSQKRNTKQFYLIYFLPIYFVF